MNRNRLVAAGAVAAVPLLSLAIPANAQESGNATVSVLHGIPTGSGADVVDVYAGDTILIDNFTPGTLKTLEVPAGSYDLAVYADGQGPGNGTAVLSAPGTQVPAGANATVTANLTEAGAPALNVFVNDTSAVAAGEGRLTVRHIAAAPAVDVRAGGTVVFSNLTNPNEAKADIAAGTVSADVVLAGTTTVAIGPADVTVSEGKNTIVYAWGSAEAGNLALATQTVDAAHSAPHSVPAGDGSTAASNSSSALPIGAAALLALGVTGLAIRRARA